MTFKLLTSTIEIIQNWHADVCSSIVIGCMHVMRRIMCWTNWDAHAETTIMFIHVCVFNAFY